ncbi:MAG: adenylate/guanylate cyclase domain-containing protein [Thermodesulfobacteriota bacterium]
MKIGIKIKLAAILSGLLVLIISTIGFILIAHQRASLEAQMRSMAGTLTHEFAIDSKIPLMQKDNLALSLLVQNILRYPGIKDAYILNYNFVIEAHPGAHGDSVSFYRDKESILRMQGPPPWLIKESAGSLIFASPIIFKGTTVGYTAVAFSDEFIQERVRTAINRVILITVFAIVGVSLLSIPLASGLLRPIFRLFKGTEEIAKGNLDYRIRESRNDEIGDLVKSFNRMASELKKKELMKGVFNRYVSRYVADEILREPERIRLGGDRREVTVLFADIRGFTSVSSKMEPELVVELLNRYFTLITEVIFRFEGTIDKFIGDAVMSVFGSPIRSNVHLEQGVKAAMAIRLAVEEMNLLNRNKGLVALEVGVGLDSGTVIVGNMGSKMRMEYTAMGYAVNMASRLTDIAKGGNVLVSETVYDAIKGNVTAEKMAQVTIKGFDGPVTLYNLVALKAQWEDEVKGIVYEAVRELEREGALS